MADRASVVVMFIGRMTVVLVRLAGVIAMMIAAVFAPSHGFNGLATVATSNVQPNWGVPEGRHAAEDD